MSPDPAQMTCQIRITFKPNQARRTRQIRLKLHAKSGSNCTPNQAQVTRQVRLKLDAKSGSNYAPNQAQITPQIKPLIRAACYRYATREKRNTIAPIRSRKLCCAEKAAHLESKRKVRATAKNISRDADICLWPGASSIRSVISGRTNTSTTNDLNWEDFSRKKGQKVADGHFGIIRVPRADQVDNKMNKFAMTHWSRTLD